MDEIFQAGKIRKKEDYIAWVEKDIHRMMIIDSVKIKNKVYKNYPGFLIVKINAIILTMITNPIICFCMSAGKTRDLLAQEYGVSRPTFYSWLKRAGIVLPARVLLSPSEVELVYIKLGKPNLKTDHTPSRAGR